MSIQRKKVLTKVYSEVHSSTAQHSTAQHSTAVVVYPFGLYTEYRSSVIWE